MIASKTIKIDVPEEYFDQFIKMTAKHNPILLVAEDYLAQQQHEIFESFGASINQPWEPNLPRTERIKESFGFSNKPQMVRTGYLRYGQSSKTLEDTPDSVTVGIDTDKVPYAYIQQVTGVGKAKTKRILIGITEDQWQILLEKLNTFVHETLGLPGVNISYE